MAVLRGILEESWQHYQHLKTKIHRRLKELPDGSVFKRQIGKNSYYYLNRRKGKKVLSKYLGKNRPIHMEREIEERRKLKRQLKEVQENLRLLSKSLKKKFHG